MKPHPDASSPGIVLCRASVSMHGILHICFYFQKKQESIEEERRSKADSDKADRREELRMKATDARYSETSCMLNLLQYF